MRSMLGLVSIEQSPRPSGSITHSSEV